MKTRTISDCGLDAAKDQPAKTFTQNTKNFDYPTGQRNNKAEANLHAMLALYRQSVYVLRTDGYLISKWGYTHHARAIESLKAFTRRLGESQ